MDLHSTFPGIPDLKRRARRRLPHFVWEYVESGTGSETALLRNRKALDDVCLAPSILHGELEFDTTKTILNRICALPCGIAPIGMSGLVWPNAERLLAQAAAQAKIPYSLSTVASQSPEDLAPYLGPDAWFQLYPPRDPEIRKDMLNRVRDAGFRTLVLTVDVPVASRRERQTRSGLRQPPKLTPRLLAQIAMRPAWAMGMLRSGAPRMRSLEKYIENPGNLPPTAHIGYLLRTSPDLDYVSWLRDHWDGPLVIKGILRPEDTPSLEQVGVDALWVSNHGGRQFDAAPASIEVLPAIRTATHLPLIFDSGIEGGLDVLRALSLGADFVMLGRAFLYGLAALGARGPAHVIDILQQDLHANMGQMGLANLSQIER
ncbi:MULTISPECIES: alpha-hydroxy acid oxidase [unclassified Ruegeria]|uniref:alpha-hydroxy acid oxidase n=1 Tax=unclassified Ruegeria TaxID=2625375 RepID=UPI00148932FC|nr:MULTISPECIES: alpha-hydroxy acid oxidase [unclassified Ruegeria]NOD74725.1 alpha-hydroxy-acid oxidizing protein [Ruegeria sp. HKCCD4332]NOD88541.1 alpha-hydroxy-acid oxidizing protein [Ruegeria sp. HKCCD4318]NOE12231.1 alpha-hydroxy-acid oxidizing protein [Ruegeria sp. HKCCD4318-2]NOG09604.1 alpha-hydroxy-acid oxidizing protein [Ruegeria sp. HKCCD4315]